MYDITNLITRLKKVKKKTMAGPPKRARIEVRTGLCGSEVRLAEDTRMLEHGRTLRRAMVRLRVSKSEMNKICVNIKKIAMQ